MFRTTQTREQTDTAWGLTRSIFHYLGSMTEKLLTLPRCMCACIKSLQSCSTPCDPMDCSLPWLLCPWDSPGKNSGVDSYSLLQGILLTQGLNLCLLCLQDWWRSSLPIAPPEQGSVVKNLPANAGDTGDMDSTPRYLGERNGYPLQYSCLENPIDRGAWWAMVHTGSQRVTRD